MRRDGMINRIHVIGNLEGPPEVSQTPNGKTIVRMDLEVMIPGRPHEHYETWHVVAYGKKAEFATQLEDGDKVYIEGFARLHDELGFEIRAGHVVGL